MGPMLQMLLEMLSLLGIDLVFVAILLAVLIPLAIYKQAAFAVLKRNFVGYFSNPTGYVFLCLFVLLTSLAAFWPHEFFTANLANLDQLNRWLPYIMVVFIPAITMSIWAEERRQGTDELLLTLPAADFDIVVGKYLAAAAIFTCSLLFSQWATYAVLVSLTLGDLDTGLLFSTYFGYWLIGLAMIALGMVASFLSSNLTVSFILGMLLNAPLAFASRADAIIPSVSASQMVSQWSFAHQFDNFGRGVISLASIVYFAMLIAIGVYVSMILIGARHWSGGRDGQSMLGHYAARAASLVVILIGASLLLSRYDPLRVDATEGRVSSVSPQTKKLVRGIDAKHPVVVEAFLSREVPEDYAKTKYNLVSMLKELAALSGGKVQLRIHDNLEPFSEEAAQADERYGIKPQTIRVAQRGAMREQEVILGVAFTCGLEKVVVPFFEYGLPVEYELVRSISTVTRGERKKLGIVTTDAQLYGGFSFAGGQPRQIPKQAIVDELEKQYEVEQVDPTNPIDGSKYDVLLVVQPSSLSPPQMSNLVDAVKAGQPTAIFEDPLPAIMGMVPGTAQPKQPPGGMFGMGGPPQPKGDIKLLWSAIGVQPLGDVRSSQVPAEVVWQRYNPYQKLQFRGIGAELVFIREEAPGAKDPFNPKEPITSGLEELLLPFPGGVTRAPDANVEFVELVATGDGASGTISAEDWMQNRDNPYMLAVKEGEPTRKKYVLAARLKGKPTDSKSDAKAGGEGEGEAEGKEEAAKKQPDPASTAADKPKLLNVVYVADIDMLDSQFFFIRSNRDRVGDEINFRFDNVTFVLNVIDELAGDDRFIDIRKRKPKHSTLRRVEERTQLARLEETKQREEFQKSYDDAVKEEEDSARKAYAQLQTAVDDMRKQQQSGEQVDPGKLDATVKALLLQQEMANRKLEVKKEKLRIDRDKKLQQTQRELDQHVQKIQNEYKFWAAFLPPIPPLLIGLAVFLHRRLREREGVSKARLK